MKFTSRVATIDLKGDHHSSLAGDFDRLAFDDVVTYLRVRLDVAQGPQTMASAKLHGRSCLIGADKNWHAT